MLINKINNWFLKTKTSDSFKKGILILLTIFSTILLLRLSINLLLILAFSPLDKTALWTTFCLCNTLKSFAFLLASSPG